jgi:hypothetical protein
LLNAGSKVIAASVISLSLFSWTEAAAQSTQGAPSGDGPSRQTAAQLAAASCYRQASPPAPQISQTALTQDTGCNLLASSDPDAIKPETRIIPGANPGPNPGVSPGPGEMKDPPKRMFGMIPDFESANNTPENQRPLTVHEKYMLALHQSFDFSAYIGDAFQSGIQQATNSQPHYGRGGGAYGERLAAAQADQTSGSMLIYGFFPAVWHEDPRYFRQGTGSAATRVWYAVSRTFVTRRDDGTNGFNKSQTVGQLVACAISTSYYPAQDRSASSVFLNWAVNLGYNSVYNVLTEYYTDMLNGIFHLHKSAAASSQAAQSPTW